MTLFSTSIFLRLGVLLALAVSWLFLREALDTRASSSAGFDPDERFVRETKLPTGRLSLEVLEEKTGVHLPSRLYFSYADGRPEDPVVGCLATTAPRMTASVTYQNALHSSSDSFPHNIRYKRC